MGLKAIVGFLLMLCFSLPLTVIVQEERGVPEEPMVLFILNMTLANYMFGSAIFMIAMADMIYSEATPLPLCASLQNMALGSALASKTSILFLAVDQYVGVVHSLHHQTIMHGWKYRMVISSWSILLFKWFFGFVAYQLDFETSAEFSYRKFGLPPLDECRLAKISEASLLLVEVVLFLLSSLAAVFYIYTAVQGMRHSRRIAPLGEADQTSLFFLRFKAFKRIVKIVLALLVLDIVFSVFRLASRWHDERVLIQIAHLVRLLCIVIEEWTYGLQYPAIQSTFWKFFGRSRRAMVQPDPQEQPRAQGNARS